MIYLAEDDDPGESSIGVVRDGGVEQEDALEVQLRANGWVDGGAARTHRAISARLGGHIFVRFFDQHRDFVIWKVGAQSL